MWTLENVKTTLVSFLDQELTPNTWMVNFECSRETATEIFIWSKISQWEKQISKRRNFWLWIFFCTRVRMSCNIGDNRNIFHELKTKFMSWKIPGTTAGIKCLICTMLDSTEKKINWMWTLSLDRALIPLLHQQRLTTWRQEVQQKISFFSAKRMTHRTLLQHLQSLRSNMTPALLRNFPFGTRLENVPKINLWKFLWIFYIIVTVYVF